MDQKHNYNRIFASSIFLISFTVYFLTIAPTTSFWDCGEFITCAYTLGVPHPPGAPFYLLLGRIFSLIPWAADIGLRVNIISAIASALTVTLTYLIIVRLITIWRGIPINFEDRLIFYSSGIIGALTFAFSDSLWFNSVEAEVYSISMFFTAIIVWLILVWHEKANDPSSDRYLLLIFYCIGLAIGVHLLNILALPAIFIIYYFRKHKFNYFTFLLFGIFSVGIFFGIYPGIVKSIPNFALYLKTNFSDSIAIFFFLFMILFLFAGLFFAIKNKSRIFTIVLMCFLLILIGASTYTGVYYRSKLNPEIDENNPENMQNLVSYINREQYGDWSYIERRAPLWEYQIKKMYVRYFGWQFIGKGTLKDSSGLLAETFSLNGLWGLPFLIGLFGMVYHFFKDRYRALSIFFLFLLTGLAIVLYLNQPDPQPRERDYVYLGSFFAFAIWIGIGTMAILETFLKTFNKKSSLQKVNLALIIGLIFLLLPLKMLAFNYHSHDRTGNYVAHDYSYNLLQSCEENGILFTNGDNDTFPLWFLQYVKNIRTDVRVVNLSLLNTPWYIRQIRDQEYNVPINLPDEYISRLAPMAWPQKKVMKIPIPKDVFQAELIDLQQRQNLSLNVEDAQPEITFELGPTFMGQAIRVQDYMILDIISAVQFKQPIYFAITVSRDNLLNLFDYLRMDGLVYKLVTYPGDKISPTRLKENLFNKFQYRNLNNPDVYYNDNTTGLLTNYRSGFLKLASFYHQEKMHKEMVETLDRLEETIPEEVIPVHDPRISLIIGNLYLEAGKPKQFEIRLERLLKNNYYSYDNKFEFALVFFQYLKNPTRAEEIILSILEEKPDYLKGYYWLFNYYDDSKNYAKGLKLAQQMLNNLPGNEQAKTSINHFQKLKNSKSDSTRF